jgi:hypothetical protein
VFYQLFQLLRYKAVVQIWGNIDGLIKVDFDQPAHFFGSIKPGRKDKPVVEVPIELIKAVLAENDIGLDEEFEARFDMLAADADDLKRRLVRDIGDLLVAAPGKAQDKEQDFNLIFGEITAHDAL